jgi:hypothetical protein
MTKLQLERAKTMWASGEYCYKNGNIHTVWTSIAMFMRKATDKLVPMNHKQEKLLEELVASGICICRYDRKTNHRTYKFNRRISKVFRSFYGVRT